MYSGKPHRVIDIEPIRQQARRGCINAATDGFVVLDLAIAEI